MQTKKADARVSNNSDSAIASKVAAVAALREAERWNQLFIGTIAYIWKSKRAKRLKELRMLAKERKTR